jgi:protein TonB
MVAAPLLVYGTTLAADHDLKRVEMPTNPSPVPVSFSLQVQSPKPVLEAKAESTTQVAETSPANAPKPATKPNVKPKKVAKKRRTIRKKRMKAPIQVAAVAPTPIAPPAEKGEGPAVAPVVESANLPSGPSVAQVAVTEPTKVASGTGLGRKSDVDVDGMLKSYIKALSRAVRKEYTYPRAAQRAGLQGRAVVRIVLDSTGAIIEVALATSSGHPILDKAALLAASSVKRLPAAPHLLDWGRRAIKVPFNFRATG